MLGCPTCSSKPWKPDKKPEPKNLGSNRAGFHLIKFQVSQFIPKKTRKFWVGSGFGYFQVFAHSNHYYAICNVDNTIAFLPSVSFKTISQQVRNVEDVASSHFPSFNSKFGCIYQI